MKQLFLKIKKILEGKKRIIACYYWIIVIPCLLIIYPTGMPIILFKITGIIGTILSTFGLSGVWAKSYIEKKNKNQLENIN